jgi:hypothetical protein
MGRAIFIFDYRGVAVANRGLRMSVDVAVLRERLEAAEGGEFMQFGVLAET